MPQVNVDVQELERQLSALSSKINQLKQQEKNKLQAGVKRDNRKGIGTRTHSVRLSDAVIIQVGDEWMKRTNHTDNPELEDALLFRKMLGEATKQDLRMVCPFWLRNEQVAMRKSKKLRQKVMNAEGR